jgi:sialidase-1
MLKIGKFFLMLAFSLQVAAGQELYVSPSGDDGNSGTREQPLATLTGARDRIRELRSRGAITDTLFVRILPGTYTLMEPFVLTVEDAGSATSPVIYTSAEADKRPLFLRPDGVENLKQPVFNIGGGVIFLGGYLVRSTDGGKRWGEPIYPPHVEDEIYLSALGEPLPAYNRGALCEGKNGRIYWVVAVNDSIPVKKTSNHLLVSDDKGLTWSYSGLVASDDNASFNEASIYETPKGDLVAFLRTANMDDQACIARSKDGGKTFRWEKMGFQGHPLNALRLPDERVLLTYGYRHKPYGIRARILNAECTDYATAPEMILREDGGNSDIGYTWPVLLDEKRVLIVYYFNKENGTRHIAGTILGR